MPTGDELSEIVALGSDADLVEAAEVYMLLCTNLPARTAGAIANAAYAAIRDEQHRRDKNKCTR